MTPEQTKELAALKAALKQHIKEAEKATPEPWEYGNEAVWNEEMNGEGNSPEEICYGLNKSDGLFIARARTMSPLACRIALVGIEALEKTAVNDDRNNHWWSTAENDLLFILTIWKGGNP